MKTYSQTISDLGDLEVFDPKAFVADKRCPAHVCDFVLGLAVAFDDFKDLMSAQQMLQCVAPVEGPPTPARGTFGGLHAHLFRSLITVVNALAELIAKNEKAMIDPIFVRVVKQLHPDIRPMWSSVVAAAKATGPKGDRFGRLIYFARNTVVSHYDPKSLSKGYQQAFLSEKAGPPYISRGDSMAETRFYFADAAAETAMLTWAKATNGSEFVAAGWSILPEMSHALRAIVTTFISTRGFAWRAAPAV